MDLGELRVAYEEYAKECSYALRLVIARLENLQEQLNAQEESYDPFESMKGRIKNFDSVVKKCDKRGYELTIESIRENVRDVVGVRIIAPFVDDVYKIADAISLQPGINIVKNKDYIKEPKENGYQSLHIITYTEVYTGKSQIIPVEIQIRTGAMNLWAKREHLLQYKGNTSSPEMQKMFKEAANFLIEFDRKIMELRDTEVGSHKEPSRKATPKKST